MLKTRAQHERSLQYRLGDHKHSQVSTQKINNLHSQMVNSKNMKCILSPKSMKKYECQLVYFHKFPPSLAGIQKGNLLQKIEN